MRRRGNLVTKPRKPNAFAHSRVDENLLRVLREHGVWLTVLPGTQKRLWSVKAVAIATGRKPRMIGRWAEHGDFLPVTRISGRPYFSEDDVDNLLRDGDFPAQRADP